MKVAYKKNGKFSQENTIRARIDGTSIKLNGVNRWDALEIDLTKGEIGLLQYKAKERAGRDPGKAVGGYCRKPEFVASLRETVEAVEKLRALAKQRPLTLADLTRVTACVDPLCEHVTFIESRTA